MMGFQFIEADQAIPTKPLMVVIGGIPGIGKTSAAFTAGDAICIDADLGVQRAIQKKRPATVRIAKYGEFRASVFSPDFEAMVKQRGVKNIIIDTVGALLDDVMAPYLIASDHKNGRAGGLSLQGWGSLASEFNLLIERFFTLGLNVIAVAHAKDDEADEQKLITLAVKGGSKEIILRKADMVGFITHQSGNRVLDFNKSKSVHVAKNTADIPASVVPDANSAQYSDFLAQIMEATNARMSEMSEAQLAANRLQADFEARVIVATDYETLQTLLGESDAIELPTVRAAAQTAIQDRAAIIALDGVEITCAADAQAALDGMGELPEAFKKSAWIALSETAKRAGVTYDKKQKAFVGGPNA